MQLAVTMHSEALLDEFSDEPDCVLVCERDEDNGTQCRGLTPENRNSSGGRKRTITETSKNLHVRPGVWLKNLAVYMFEGRKGQTSLVARGKAAAIGTAATGT